MVSQSIDRFNKGRPTTAATRAMLQVSEFLEARYENIETDIRGDLPQHDVSAYHLIAGNSNEFGNGTQGSSGRSHPKLTPD